MFDFDYDPEMSDEAILDDLAQRGRVDHVSPSWAGEEWLVVHVDRDGDRWKVTCDEDEGWITFTTTDPAVVMGVIDDLLTDADHGMSTREWLLDGNTQLSDYWLEATRFTYEPPLGVGGAFSLLYLDPEIVEIDFAVPTFNI